MKDYLNRGLDNFLETNYHCYNYKSQNTLINYKLQNTLIENGLKFAQKFSWKKTAEDTLKSFEEIFK